MRMLLRTLTLIAAFTVVTAFGQGQVNFGNTTTLLTSPPERDVHFDQSTIADLRNHFATNNSPVVNVTNLVFTNLYRAQLYYATNGTAEGSLIAVTNVPALFRASTTTLPGTWIGGLRNLLLPGLTNGANVSLQVRVWDGYFAPTYEAALALSTTTPMVLGKSAVFDYTVPTSGNPAPTDLVMTNLLSFAIGVSGPPKLITQPGDQTNKLASTAAFTMTCDGGPTMTYLVYKTNTVSHVVTLANSLTTPNFLQTIITNIVIDEFELTTNITYITNNLYYNRPLEPTPAPVTASVANSHAGVYFVVVTNAFGSVTSSLVKLVVDSAVPAVTVLTPAASLNMTNSNQVTVRGTASDTLALANVLISLNGGPFVPATTVAFTSPQSANWTNEFTVPTTQGNNTWTVKAVDIAGNTASLNKVSKQYWTVTVTTNGSGSPFEGAVALVHGKAREIGTTFTLKGKPAPNNLFSNWTQTGPGPFSVASTLTPATFTVQSNMVLQVNFVTNRFVGAAGNYYGLFSDSLGVAHESAGFITLTISSGVTNYTGKIILEGDVLTLTGVPFNLQGQSTKVVTRNGRPSLTVKVDVDLNGGDVISGTVSNMQVGGWVADVAGGRGIYKPSTTNTPYSGAYTMVIPGSLLNSANEPGGDGYAMITVKTNGVITISGKAGDTETLGVRTEIAPATAHISKNGEWPFYVSMYKTTRTPTIKTFVGSLTGWLYVTNGSSGLGGDLFWNKKGAGPVTFLYPVGFTNQITILGSPYAPTNNTWRAMDITNGTATVQNGDIALFINSVTWNANNLITVNPVILNNLKFALGAPPVTTVIAKTGYLKGKFDHPGLAPAKATIEGVILQNAKVARGVFKGTTQTGSMLLEGTP